MMESLRQTYKDDDEEDEEWSDALDRRLSPPSAPPPLPSSSPSDSPLTDSAAGATLPVAVDPSPPQPLGNATLEQEETEPVADEAGIAVFGVAGEEGAEEKRGREKGAGEKQKGAEEVLRRFSLGEDEEMEDGEEEEEDDQEEGEDDEEDEEEGLAEENGGGGRHATPLSPLPSPSPDAKFASTPDPEAFKLSNCDLYDEDDEGEEEEGNEDEDDDYEEGSGRPPKKKQKSLSCLISPPSILIGSGSVPSAAVDEAMPPAGSSPATLDGSAASGSAKKSKKRNSNVWKKPTSRKSKKKGKSGGSNNHVVHEDKVLITPIPRFPDRSDDSLDANICLSRVYKAEKVELSEDRLTAGSTKGYRMVRATRGVIEGAWYFEIKVIHMGVTGHTRLGWTMEKGDLQAPVGYDGNSYGYRDIDGSKIHKALRENYGDGGYAEGDVIGFYINLPDGASYAPKPPNLVWYKGQKYVYPADGKDEPPKPVPESEIVFFKNGLCQGTAFRDVFGGRYYPAASMYTLPNQPNCEVSFNFGPSFQFFPADLGGRPVPKPMAEATYHGFVDKAEGQEENGASEKKQVNGSSS